MELIIYGTFLALALLAYGARRVANKGDDKKISISNINFKSFQKSFFLVYFLALLGDWLQGPYVYKLYAFYGFKESQIAILYVVGFASSVVFGTCTGPLADTWGRRKMAIAFSVIYTFCCLTNCPLTFGGFLLGDFLEELPPLCCSQLLSPGMFTSTLRDMAFHQSGLESLSPSQLSGMESLLL
eukprot:TRINITY_DN10885_c0_g1_i2.p1 TRINITY_DN10885_c0_g1~~TRINITY_DN10885_c0_g1_i2.p1  ORF type:complete len:184 (+),score=21.62 TRINITY_DN10885_c0_g1_i2:99-650(+)